MSSWSDRYAIFERQALKYCDEVKLDDFSHSVYCSLNQKFFYGETPKTGCSTIKKVLIQAELGKRINFENLEYIHYREFSPLLKIWQIGNLEDFFTREDIFKFCFVRNPYTRLLSAYLDKIVNDKYQAQHIKIQMGLSPDSKRPISFEDFVDVVIVQPVMYMDLHWRTQYHQTFQKNINYDFIGRFETFEDDFLFVLQKLGIDPNAFYDAERSHATHASKHIQDHYTPEIAEKVYRKYKIDFDYFGYSSSLNSLNSY